MARDFKEVASLRTDINKYHANYDQIDWGNGKAQVSVAMPDDRMKRLEMALAEAIGVLGSYIDDASYIWDKYELHK
jgi:hypothetical protein